MTEDEGAALQAAVRTAQAGFVEELHTLVDLDSGSYQPDGVEAVAGRLMSRLARLGASVRREPDPRTGTTHVATFRGREGGARVLLIGHADTVFEPGTALERPFRVEERRAHGPGVLDMKGGLLLGLGALATLRERGPAGSDWLPVSRLDFVVNPDEEIGSPASTEVIAQLAAGADVALVLEGARANGDIVSARAGMTHLRIDIRGRAAHAGVEPERGRSAVLEAAHKIVALHALNDPSAGVSVNAGMVAGGTRPNVVPEAASVTLDLRARRRPDQERALRAIEAIASACTVPDTTATLERLASHWPLERTPESERLAELAVASAAELGLAVGHTATGGTSDGNTTAALGVPTLDGLGPVGGGAHAPDEYLELDSVEPRTALLASLLLAIGRDPAYRRP